MISLASLWTDPAAQRRIAAGFSVLLVVVLAWLLARLFWLLMAPGDGQEIAAVPAQLVPDPPRGQSVQMDRYHLFGEYAAHPTVAAYHDAPETALNLELRGIVSSADPDSGFAIIVASGRQASYNVGEEVPGGAEVRGIYPDRVVLWHAGRHETLRLPVERPGASVTTDAAQDAATDSASSPLAVSLAGWKDKLSVSLDTAAQYSLIPVREGGYRLFLSRDAQQMTRLGLRNGDVVKSANGIPLNSQADVESVITQVLAGEILTLLVERNGEEMSLTPDLEQFIPGVR